MPKRNRQRNRGSSQSSSDSEHASEAGHTPKWTRSSPSDSEEPDAKCVMPQAKEEKSTTHEMQCILPGHPPLILQSHLEYELHYTKDHNNQCIACRANLPSPWLLELHHEENHDPLVAAKRDDGEKTYRCFLQDCEKITLTAQKRRLHLIDKHQFPRNYDFRLVDSGLKGKSLLRQVVIPSGSSSSQKETQASTSDTGASRKSRPQHISETPFTLSKLQSVVNSPKADVAKSRPKSSAAQKPHSSPSPEGEEDALDSLSKAMSSLKFVPMSVRMKGKKNSNQSTP